MVAAFVFCEPAAVQPEGLMKIRQDQPACDIRFLCPLTLRDEGQCKFPVRSFHLPGLHDIPEIKARRLEIMNFPVHPEAVLVVVFIITNHVLTKIKSEKLPVIRVPGSSRPFPEAEIGIMGFLLINQGNVFITVQNIFLEPAIMLPDAGTAALCV